MTKESIIPNIGPFTSANTILESMCLSKKMLMSDTKRDASKVKLMQNITIDLLIENNAHSTEIMSSDR